MLKQLLKMTALFLALALPSLVYAKQFTGQDLLEDCQSAIRFVDSRGNNQFVLNGSMCMAYLDGFEDIHRIYSVLMDVKKYPNFRLYCLPANYNDLQLANVIVKYLTDNPAKVGEPASSLVIEAFTQTFPCPTSV